MRKALFINGSPRKNGNTAQLLMRTHKKGNRNGSLDVIFGDPAGIRTPDPQLRRLLLYPAELPDHP